MSSPTAREETSTAGVVVRVDAGEPLYLSIRGAIDTIDWLFRFRGQLIHKVCHFFLIESADASTSPQLAEGITACRWVQFHDAESLVSYGNARDVLRRARALVGEWSAPA